MKVFVAGDFCPYDRVARLIDEGSFELFFSEVKEVNSHVDLSIVNFESTTIEKGDAPIKKAGPNLGCDKKAFEALKWGGFDVACFANNHFRDYGDAGVKRSIESAQSAGLDFVGGGRTIEEASRVLYKTIGEQTIAIINVCEHEYSIATESKAGSNPIDPIAQYYQIQDARSHADYIIIIAHGGHEHCPQPSKRMRQWYRWFIDIGADAVINCHQHCYCSYERYNNKPIFYGLGNFCFDWPGRRNIAWNRGFAVILELQKESVRFELLPYVQGDENVAVHFTPGNKEFFDNIAELNSVLGDPVRYEKSLQDFYDGNPYFGGVARGIRRTKILKAKIRTFLGSKQSSTGVSQRYYLNARDLIECESHRDRIIHELRKKTEE